MPAFRSDMIDFSELFLRKRFPGRDDAIRFYADHIQSTVMWELEENSGWFRDRFLADLEDENSALRRNLGEQYQGKIVSLLDDLKKESILGRDLIDSATKDLPRKYRRMIQNYRELLYHVSGARVVNCESALPQENYIDYDLADLRQKRSRLTEEQVLCKILVELVLDSLQRNFLSVEMLDCLSFDDVIKIRQPLLESRFQDKYDKLIQSVVGPYDGEKFRVFDVDELDKIRSELARTFDEVLRKELPEFQKKKFK